MYLNAWQMDYWNDSLLSTDRSDVWIVSAVVLLELIDTLSTKTNNNLLIIYNQTMVWSKQMDLSDLISISWNPVTLLTKK